MATPEPVLRAEGETLGRHLLGEALDPGVVDRYVAWHATPAARDTDVDCVLVAAARRGGMELRLADAFAARFRRNGPLRRKLVLLLALAECSPSNAARLDRSRGRGPSITLLVIGVATACEVAVLVLATLRFGLAGGRAR